MNQSNRLISLDAFRGMTIAAMIFVNFPGGKLAAYKNLRHAPWEGVTPADFIFPFFIFIVGISIVLSFDKQLERGCTRSQIAKKSIWRAIKIFVLGLALRLLPTLDLSRMELPGVLQRIALVFLACAFLYLFTTRRTQLYTAIGILVAYWLALILIPVPGIGAGVLEPGKNLAHWMDHIVIPASLLNKKGYDSEGFLSTIPAIATGITGMMAGFLLKRKTGKEETALLLLVTGVVLTLAGHALGLAFPVIKKIWTSSFVLITSGWAFSLFALLFWIIEVKEWKIGINPWIIIGSNAIAIYVLADVFETIFLRTGFRNQVMEMMEYTGFHISFASLIWSTFTVLLCYLAATALHRKHIFVKL